MWLVLCESGDASARWAFEGLKARGLAPLVLVPSQDLAFARWEHRVGAEGTGLVVTLQDGRVLRHEELAGALNRLLYVPQESLMLIAPPDRDYVLQELNAFYMSWLHGIDGPVLGLPTPQSLCGRVRHVSEWSWLAARAGLRVPPYRQSSRAPSPPFTFHPRVVPAGTEVQTMLVIAGRVLGPAVPEPVVAACRRLAELARAAILGIELTIDGWSFAGATTYPDLRLGGDAALDALAAALTVAST